MFKPHTLRRRRSVRFILSILVVLLCSAVLFGWGRTRLLRAVKADGNFLTALWSPQTDRGKREQQQQRTGTSRTVDSRQISPEVKSQIQSILQEKAQRTPAQKKIDSNLLYAIKQRQGTLPSGAANLELNVSPDSVGMVVVEFRANLGGTLIENIEASGGHVISALPKYRSVLAQVPIDQVEKLAARPDVLFVQPQPVFMTHGTGKQPARSAEPVPSAAASPVFQQRAQRVRSYVKSALTATPAAGASNPFGPFISPAAPFVGSQNSEGDKTHRADIARVTFGVSGAGIKIGVISDSASAASITASQARGDLGPVTVLTGQAGTGTDEGTAMLEIVHDVAPDAQLYFATANPTAAQFAQNIRDLRTAGCDIIVDDVIYFSESPFQDGQASGVISPNNGGVVMQAVNDVTAAGAMYFSSAGNQGNQNDGTSGTWEGDFADGGAVSGPIATAGETGNFHDFGGGQTWDVVTVVASSATKRFVLYWSDPLGGSNNDYDLFLLNSTGTTLKAFSVGAQSGTQDPYEIISTSSVAVNDRLVVVKSSGANRFLHVEAYRGQLGNSTQGETHGHASAANAFCVAATPAAAPAPFGLLPNPVGPFPNAFTASNTVERFSSDGPRRLFFNADGTAITPGNVSATGGLVRQKPDITAADGVSTSLSAFAPFFGTSAAAPHAAAIACLIKSGMPTLTNAQIRTALINTAIDIEGAGVDRDSGAGIIMPYPAMQSLGMTPSANLVVGTVSATESPLVDGNIDPGESAKLAIQLLNLGAISATNISATLSTSTPGITISSPATISYPNITVGGNAVSANPFFFSVASSVACPTTVNFTLTVTFSGGPSPRIIDIPVSIGQPPFSVTTTLDTTTPASSTGVTTSTDTQMGRLSRNGINVQCGGTKVFPGIVSAGTSFRYDAYTFATCGMGTQCVTVEMTGTDLSNLFVSAYSGNYDPNNKATGYLADAGSSFNVQSFSFNITAGSTFTILVNDNSTTGAGVGTQYSLNVSGMCTVCSTTTLTPIMAVTGNNNPITNGSNAPSATNNTDFGSTAVAGGTVVKSFTIANTGTGQLDLYGNPKVAISGTNAADFTVTAQPTSPVAATNGTTNFQITFDPSASGLRTATVSIANNDPTKNPYTFAIQGTGTPSLTAAVADPAVCIDPGGLVGITATVTNPNPTQQIASWTATLPTGLTAVAGTCAADVDPGNCTIMANGGTVGWSGMLAANQTVTIIYRARIAATVASGAQLCILNQALVANIPATLNYCFNVVCPTIVDTRVSDTKAGSVLVFPYYTSTIGGASDTRLTISNISNAAGTVANQAYVHLFLIDGTSCQQADLYLCLTPNASFSFKASDYDPGNTGYVIAVAVNNQGVPIQNNVLIGNAFVNTPDFADNYGAESFAANSFAVATVAGNAATLYFDDIGYDAVPKQFAVEIQSPIDAAGQQVVTSSLSGNLVSSQMSGATQVSTGLVYNGNEKPFGSFNNWLTGTCQAKAIIATNSPRVPNGMAVMVPSGQAGTLRFSVGAAVGLIMTPRTATWKGIRTLHKTQTVATTLTIPIFAPVC